MKKFWIILMLIICFGAGCTKTWYRPGTSDQTMKHDHWICKQKTRDALINEEISRERSKSFYISCMEEKGYVLMDKGKVEEMKKGSPPKRTTFGRENK